jgi:hypothetical protein
MEKFDHFDRTRVFASEPRDIAEAVNRGQQTHSSYTACMPCKPRH